MFLECWRSLTVRLGYSSIFCFGKFCFQMPNASYVSGYFWSSTGVPSEVRQIAVRDISAAVCLQAVVLEPCICQWNPAIVLQEPVNFIIGHVFLECWRSLTLKIGYSSNLISSASYLQMPNPSASCVTGYVEIMTRIMVRMF